MQRELSDITMASPAKAKFRMTSDRFMNPNNAPSEFDKVAMGVIRDSGASEYSEVRGGQLLYARRLIADKGCLKCHGAPASAPAAVTALYPGPQGVHHHAFDDDLGARRDQRGDSARVQLYQFHPAF